MQIRENVPVIELLYYSRQLTCTMLKNIKIDNEKLIRCFISELPYSATKIK